MCGRITQSNRTLPGLARLTTVDEEPPTRWNGAPSQDFWVIRRDPETGDNRRDRMIWGFCSPWMAQKGLAPKINATCEALATSGMWRSSYAKRRCIIPVDNFFEWRAATPGLAKQPYAIAMRDREPFALAGIWTGYEVAPGQWQHNFAIITCPANELVSAIHHRMPVILAPAGYERWLANLEPDPEDLLRPYPSDLLTMWAISRRVNAPRNDNPDILAPVDEPDD